MTGSAEQSTGKCRQRTRAILKLVNVFTFVVMETVLEHFGNGGVVGMH